MTTDERFSSLPTFDATQFEPPVWAKDVTSGWNKNGESSRGRSSDGEQVLPRWSPGVDDGPAERTTEDEEEEDRGDDDDEDENEGEEIWADAKSDVDPDEAKFSLAELEELLQRAVDHKAAGNSAFTSKPPRHEAAVAAYLAAIGHLPDVPPAPVTADPGQGAGSGPRAKAGGAAGTSGIQEVTEEEAEQIVREAKRAAEAGAENQEVRRRDVEGEIRETTRACWGNLAACYIAMKEDQKAVDACTHALKIDSNYIKGLHRRATANVRIGSLSALTSAREDYTALLALLPASSPLIPPIRRSLVTLSDRIKVAEKEQLDEMMGKLKNLGNMFLGNFGLSTDNFKFEKGEGGGYNMQFQR
ncbi:hypothetical protein IAU60_000619 [Kwoniella sp. DSM 27419]